MYSCTDLDGIAPTEACAAGCAERVEKLILTLPARRAIRLTRQFDTFTCILPHIHPEHGPAYFLVFQEYLQCFGRSNTSNRPYDTVKYPCSIAGGTRSGQWHFGEDTAQARGITWQDIHGYSIRGNNSAIDPWAIVFYTHIIEQVARLKVVRRVKYQVHIAYQ